MPRNDVVRSSVVLMTFRDGKVYNFAECRHCEADGWFYKFLSLLSREAI